MSGKEAPGLQTDNFMATSCFEGCQSGGEGIVCTALPFGSWQIMKHTWWRHQMETFSALLALCAGNSPVPVNSPHKGQWRGALIFSFIYAWINDWVNNRECWWFETAGWSLWRHRNERSDFTLEICVVISDIWNTLNILFRFLVSRSIPANNQCNNT